MKKRFVILAGILAVSIAAAGCGDKDDDTDETAVEATSAPTPTVTAAVVQMETIESETEEIENVMGTKTETSSSVIITNELGYTISEFYVRANTDDDDTDTWGDDLIDGAFTLEDQEKAIYYYEPDQTDEDGNAVTLWDLWVRFSDEDVSSCFFRKLPLSTIETIRLCIEGDDDDWIPYAIYTTTGSTTEVSTLQEVRQRLGLDDEDEDEDEDTEATPTPTPGVTEEAQATATPVPAEEPADTTTSTDDTDDDEETDPAAEVAAQYIGQSLDALISACGSPNGSDYQNEPETGETGYHYYDTFTVSTSVDEDGNETVAGVW